jgi:vitamin B12 transporter
LGIARLSRQKQGLLCVVCSGVLLLNLAVIARAAQTDEDVAANSGEVVEEEEVVVVEAVRPDWEAALSPGAVTVVELDKYRGEQKTLPDLLQEVAGVHVRYISGKGQYTTVSTRGSTGSQVGVFVDGVLVNLGGDAAVDISTIPMGNIERIEIYRGYVPSRFAGTWIGGVINIVTKKPRKPNVAVAWGGSSYDGRTGSLKVDAPLGRGSLLLGVNRDQSDGDFKYENYYIADYLLKTDYDGPIPDSTRYRRNNSYKNTDTLLKWQDGHWTIKGARKEIDRMMPNSIGKEDLWTDINTWTATDPKEQDYYDRVIRSANQRKRQKINEKNLQVGRRDTWSNLEWGWRLDYLEEDKSYWNYDAKGTTSYSTCRPLSVWSTYNSDRVNVALDGVYKAGARHLLELMTNYSYEVLDIDGNGMKNLSKEAYWRWKYRYEQDLYNIQLQDTVTLNRAGDFQFTPNVRYNSSVVKGYGRTAPINDTIWKSVDTQRKGKTTWQGALKKELNDYWTLRSTFGSYYRLLNLYEICGDGAGILPRPYGVDGTTEGVMYPEPEEGTQWDLSALWQGRALGAKANATLTYFDRDVDNLLVLYRFGYTYWSYSNAARGKVKGVELETGFHWDRWDFELTATYLDAVRYICNTMSGGDPNYFWEEKVPYTPKWEGNVRLIWRPATRLTLFAEAHYTGKMYLYGTSSEEWAQCAFTTGNLGLKYKLSDRLQVNAGVNDLCDQGAKLHYIIRRTLAGQTAAEAGSYWCNMEYPLQGRTYYTTLQLNF